MLALCCIFNSHKAQNQKPKNIVLVVIDGFGMSHLSASAIANGGNSNLFKLTHTGFLQTNDSTNLTVDPVSAISSIACGIKTYEGGLGKDENKNNVQNMLELAKKENKVTGLITTSSITYTSPAAFFAHQLNYNKRERIASSILESELDVFIGGGMKYFNKRSDGEDLTRDLRKAGYKLYHEVPKLEKGRAKKVAGLVYPDHPAPASSNDQYLQLAWHKAFRTLIKDDNGYFMVVNLTQIDWACRANNGNYLLSELTNLEQFIEQVYKYVGVDRRTLLIVCSSYQRGHIEWVMKNDEPDLKILSKSVKAELVPVFANGPGAENFTGVYKNTELYMKIKSLLF